jgi:hypothetical protein
MSSRNRPYAGKQEGIMARNKDKHAALRGMVDAILTFAATIERKRAEGYAYNVKLRKFVKIGGRRREATA